MLREVVASFAFADLRFRYGTTTIARADDPEGGRCPLFRCFKWFESSGFNQALSITGTSSESKSWTGWPGMMVEIACL
jgi:hypothetical protein